MKQYLQPSQVAQVVKLLHNGTFWSCKNFCWSAAGLVSQQEEFDLNKYKTIFVNLVNQGTSLFVIFFNIHYSSLYLFISFLEHQLHTTVSNNEMLAKATFK